ncbi:hypothetical protein CHN51_11470 [Sphingorhabdus sp. YGSMI21]|nr:hypothetical protein CHN51_11470 [Sphingorhabdus sp. YGSMI21]
MQRKPNYILHDIDSRLAPTSDGIEVRHSWGSEARQKLARSGHIGLKAIQPHIADILEHS